MAALPPLGAAAATKPVRWPCHVSITIDRSWGVDPSIVIEGWRYYQDRYYPHKGTPGFRAGQSFHAIADIEIPGGVAELKTKISINRLFIPKFLGLEDRVVGELVDRFPGVGLKFFFSYPQSFRDTLDSTVQPVGPGNPTTAVYFSLPSSLAQFMLAFPDPSESNGIRSVYDV
ncbi:hypothetical protein K438DRAFT_1992818 [Mycena galopus ATCC 62051]|nr:hypothetical protein K438DRAFT_1992818 [Mycena galopus ATCC 62051]